MGCHPEKSRVEVDNEAIVRSVVCAGGAVSAVLQSFRDHPVLAGSLRKAQFDAHQALMKLPLTTTPFGAVCLCTVVDGTKGSIDVFHVNPSALLYHALMVSKLLKVFLDRCQCSNPNGSLTIAFYLDEATPGNQHRPDRGRCSQCLY